MLNAVLKGKTQGVLRQDYTGAFTGYEDSLTATIFERLLYLSHASREGILDAVLQQAGIPWGAAALGAVQTYEFWPQWPAEAGGYVEPDLYIQFAAADLIVEAKRWDLQQQQQYAQWAREITARPLGRQGQPLLLLAIGGLSEHDARHVAMLKSQALASAAFANQNIAVRAFYLLATSWRQFALFVRAQRMNPGLAVSDRFILNDMLAGLALHDINVNEQRFFDQFPRDLTRLELTVSPMAQTALQTAFRPNSGRLSAHHLSIV